MWSEHFVILSGQYYKYMRKTDTLSRNKKENHQTRGTVLHNLAKLSYVSNTQKSYIADIQDILTDHGFP